MIQPTSKVISYTPFKISFIFSFVFLAAWIGFFVAANVYCMGSCLYNSSFIFSCTNGGSLYCCSYTDTSGSYYCGYYSSCIFDNDSCGIYAILSWVSGALLFVTLIVMVVSAFKFNRLKQQALLQQQYQVQAPQNYAYPQGNPIYYQNPNPNNQNNNYYPNNGNNPPAYYPQR